MVFSDVSEQLPRGYAATIAIGSTTTTAPGSTATVINSGNQNDATFNFGIPRGATGAIGATGATGAPGQDGLSSSVFIYTFSDQTTGTPTNGHLFLNNTNVSLSTILNVSHIDKTPGHDIDQLLNTVNIGSKIIIQHSTDSNIYINYYITSKTINTGYVSYGITYDSKLGTIVNNQEVIIIIQMAGIAGPAGATGATGATGAQGPSSSVFDYKLDRINFNNTSMTSGTIRFNNTDITIATEIYVHYLNEFGLDWQRMISLFPTHSTIIIQDKATANYILYDIPNLIVRTANQFITIPVSVKQHVNASALTNNLSVYLSNQSGTIGLDGATGATGATGAPGATGATGADGAPGTAGSSTEFEYTFFQAGFYGTVPTFNLINMASGAVTNIGGSLTIGTNTGINQLTKTYHVRSNTSTTANGSSSGWVGTTTFQPFYVGQGFKITYNFGLLDTTTNAATRSIIGIGNFNTAVVLSSTATVQSLTNQFVGIIQEVGETVFSFYSKGPGASGITPIASTVACTTVNTGWYTATFHNDVNSSNVIITIKYVVGGVITTSTQTILCGGANTLSTSQACYPIIQRSMASAGGTTGSAILAINSLKFYTR